MRIQATLSDQSLDVWFRGLHWFVTVLTVITNQTEGREFADDLPSLAYHNTW